MKQISPVGDEQKIIDAHNFLLAFTNKFDKAARGGIHDFMEVMVSNMLSDAINEIDKYMSSGHDIVSASEIMALVCEAFIRKVDESRRKIDSIPPVYMS